MKQIETLTQDVYELIDKGMTDAQREAAAGIFKEFGDKMASMLTRQVTPYVRKARNISFSSLGYGARRLYYQYNGMEGEAFTPNTKVKFMLGNVVEELMLSLAKLAGHSVQGEQDRIEYRGITGYRDAVIDGVTVDVKSAASFSFQKIKAGLDDSNDLFGYRMQLKGYMLGDKSTSQATCALWVMDKQLGHITLAPFNAASMPDVDKQIDMVNSVYKMTEPPERCYELVPEGKSGNMKLPVGCAYCPFKKECYKDTNGGKGLRTFLYYRGPTHFAHIAKEPNVQELT